MGEPGKETELTRKRFKRIRKNLREIEELVGELELELEPDTRERDFDVLAVAQSKGRQRRIENIQNIIRALEQKEGEASIDRIVEETSKLGYYKDIVEAEIDRLVQEEVIFEPVRFSGKYRLCQD